MDNRFRVKIKPVKPDFKDQVIEKILLFIGPNKQEKAQELADSGGVVPKNLNQKAAEITAAQLRKAGAKAEVVPIEENQREPQDLFSVRLASVGERKIWVIKVVRGVTKLGLKESKELVENLGIVEDGVSREAALKTKIMLEDAGATVKLEPIGESNEDEFIVHGRVTIPNGEPAGNLLVRAYDRDLRSKQLLGEATTLKDGKYRVQYSREDFSKAEKHRVDLVISIYNELGLPLQAEFSRDGTIFNADKEEEVNVQVLEGEPIIPSEYDKLTSFLTPLLDGGTLESLTDGEIEFLVHESKIGEFDEEFPAGADSIAYLSESAKRSEETGLQTDVFYSWARLIKGVTSKDKSKALRLNLEKLLENSNENLIETLQSAIDDNIIPKKIEDQLERVADLLQRLRNEKSLKERENWKTYEIQGRLLNKENEEALNGFNVTAKDLKANSTFQNLGTITTGPEGNFSFGLQVTDNESDTSREIEWIVTTPSNEDVHRETVAIVPAADQPFTLTVTVPKPKLPGEDITVSDLPLQFSSELKSILESNGITNMAHLLKKGGVTQLSDMPDGLRDSDEVRQLQGFAHLSLLSPDLETEAKIKQSLSLMTHGYFSPHDIADESLADFQTNLSEELSAEHLVEVYNIGKAQSYLLDNYAVDHLTNLRSSGQTNEADEEISQQDPRLSCTCEDCLSAISPGAYLTDLVGYITKHVRNTDTNKKIDLDFLVDTFHHPLKALPINCAATKNEIRQVRIAIEVLYKSLETQVNSLSNSKGIKDYIQSSYEALLRETGTSLRNLQRASFKEEKEKIAERIGIEVEHVEKLYLQESPQDTSNLLSENNLERIFGLPAFLNVDDGSLTLHDPLRFLKEESDKPLLYEWRLEYMQNHWENMDFQEDDYSEGKLSIIDPDLIGPDDFRDPSLTDKNFSIWLKRRNWLDENLNEFWSLIDTQLPEASLDKIINKIQEEYFYTPEGGQSEVLKPWSETTNREILLEKFEEISSGSDTYTIEAWLDKRHLTFDAFTALAKIADEFPSEDDERNEAWHIAIDILAQSLKKAFYPIWVQEEISQGIELDPRVFWNSLTEPKDGNWSVLVENDRPLIDPETVEQRDLPDGTVGENARKLWEKRINELNDKKKELLTQLQTDEGDRLVRTLGLALGNPTAVPNAEANWTSVIEELNKQQQSLDGPEREEAERIIEEELFLGTDDSFSRLVQLNNQIADQNVKPEKEVIEKVAADLTTAYKQKNLYAGWSQEESDQDMVYWRAYKARLPKWRGGLEARFSWKHVLDKRSQAPIIDPDIVPGDAIAEPVPGKKVFDLWRERTKELDQKLQDLQGFDISTRDGVSNLYNEVLGITLDELIELGKSEEEGQPIDGRLDQVTLNREAYWVLLEVAQRTEESKTVLGDTWQNVRAILLQVWKKRQYAEWRKEEKRDISLSPKLFTLPASRRFQLKDIAPELSWRRDTRRQREWQRTLRSRLDQQNSISASLKEVISTVEEQSLPQLRDHLIEFSDTTSGSLAEKADRLTERYLIDMRNSGCQTVTRVGIALEVFQTLVFSVRLGQLDLGDIELQLMTPNFDAKWRWMGSYATWKAAMGVFLFPEQILLPTLRRHKTPIFRRFVKGSSNMLTPSAACELSDNYYKYLDDVTSLEVVATCWTKVLPQSQGGCVDDDGDYKEDKEGRLYMFALSRDRKHAYWSFYIPSKDNPNNYPGTGNYAHSYWQPIEIDVEFTEIFGATARGKSLYLFVRILSEEKESIGLLRFDLNTKNWDEVIEINLPENTKQFSLALVDDNDTDNNDIKLICSARSSIKRYTYYQPSTIGFLDGPGYVENGFIINSKIYDTYYYIANINATYDGLWDNGWRIIQTLPYAQEYALEAAVTYHGNLFIFSNVKSSDNSYLSVIGENALKFSIKYFVGDHELLETYRQLDAERSWYQSLISYARNEFTVERYKDEISKRNREIDKLYEGNTKNLYREWQTEQRLELWQANGLVKGVRRITNNSNLSDIFIFFPSSDGTLTYRVLKDWNPSSKEEFRDLSLDEFEILSTPIEFPDPQNLFLKNESARTLSKHSDRSKISGDKLAIVYNTFNKKIVEFGPALVQVTLSNGFNLGVVLGRKLAPRLRAPSYKENASLEKPIAIGIRFSEEQQKERSKWVLANTLNNLSQISNTDYLNEAYYFLPIYLALRLQRNGFYQEALGWFRVVYDYQLNEIDREIAYLLQRDNVNQELEANNIEWADPINPHALSKFRNEAYTKFTILSLIRCLLDFAEEEFTLDTVESIARARILFNTASNLLDTPPLKSKKPSCQKIIGSLSYQVQDTTLAPLWEAVLVALKKVQQIGDLRDKIAKIEDVLSGDGSEESKLLDALRIAKRGEDSMASFKIIPNIHVLLERNRRLSLNFNIPAIASFEMANYNWPTTTDTTVYEGPAEIEPVYQGIDFEFSPGVQYAFCVPENPTVKFLKLRANLNLFKIRNCMNIAGMRRELEPYAAPTDVESALPSMGAGGQINLPGTNQIRPTQYRYNVLVERARQMAGLAQQTESAFLSALQSKDQEAYTLFIAKQNVQTSKAGVKLQNLRLREAENGVGLAELQLEKAGLEENYFASLLSEGISNNEVWALSSMQIAIDNFNDAAIRHSIAAGSSILEMAAGVAFMTMGVPSPFGLSTTGVLSSVAAAKSSYASKYAQQAQMLLTQASFERRAEEWRFQKALTRQDIAIGKQQIRLAEDRVGTVEQEREIAELQTEQAEDVVQFLQNKFTSAELYDWMSGVLERIFRYYLQQGASMAKLAENQLAFERQEALLGVIQNDYYELVSKDDSSFGSNDDSDTNRRGLTGSARLLRDITKLDQYAFTTDQRKQQLSMTFSLAQLDPFAFQQFRQTGVLMFDTSKEYFDRRFPGQYLRLIKKVRTSVIALVPPTQGVNATLNSSGISRVVTGGDIYQTRIIRRDPETIAFTTPIGATGVFELNPNPGMLLPFEGNGVDTRWEFRMPEAANSMDFSTIADVLFTIEYTAFHDFNYQQQVQRKLDPYISADRAFSFRQQYADAWYDLNNPEQSGTPMSVRFDTRREDFPPNVSDVSISQILLYFISDKELPEALMAELTFSQNGVSLGGEAAPIEGVISTRRGNGSSWFPIIGKEPGGDWQLTLPNTTRIKSLFKDEVISDILFVVTYTGELPVWPNE